MDLNPAEMDALVEIINIGVGRAASILNQMVRSAVELSVPSVKVMDREAALAELSAMARGRVASVSLMFSGSLQGGSSMLFPPKSAARLANVLTGSDPDDLELDSMKIGTLSEVGNILLNGIIGSISNIIGGGIGFKVPVFAEGPVRDIILKDVDESQRILVLAETRFALENLRIHCETLLILGMQSFAELLDAINQMMRKQGK